MNGYTQVPLETRGGSGRRPGPAVLTIPGKDSPAVLSVRAIQYLGEPKAIALYRTADGFALRSQSGVGSLLVRRVRNMGKYFTFALALSAIREQLGPGRFLVAEPDANGFCALTRIES